jgi:serine phosphatase RsbU (regulator of sigma subunit)/pSer/pThr/pTyr-binding forkhead associated (FHA) protein
MSARNSVLPTLELICPTLPARLIELDADPVRVGRDPTSDIWLDLKQVSWSHARVGRRPDGGYFVEDLDSYNSTFLDGARLPARTPTPLKDGSRVKICDVTLVFHLQAVEVRDEAGEEETIVGSLEDMSSLTLAARTERAAVVLRAVLEINRVLAGTIELNEVLGRALRELFAIFRQAECGFILTREPDDKLNPRATLQRDGSGPAKPLTLSRTVLDHVTREGRALLITDVTADSRFPTTDSLSGTGIRTAMCVPVTGGGGTPIGIIQLDSRVQKVSFGPEDLELLAAVAVPIGVVIENHRLLRERAALSAAGEVQAALLPRRRPELPGYTFWERYQPALEVGGDYYDYIPVEDDLGACPGGPHACPRWAVAVGDVTGKGMPAALLMANLCAEVRHLVRSGAPPHEVAVRVNRHVFDAELPGRFVTFALVLVDTDGHRLTVVNAGHMPPLVRRADGKVEPLGQDDSGLPLGVERESTYPESSAALGPGDVVVLYTDGVNEAVSRQDTFFGVDGLTRAIAPAAGGAARVGEAVLRALRAHVGGRPQSDDIALVCFGRD